MFFDVYPAFSAISDLTYVTELLLKDSKQNSFFFLPIFIVHSLLLFIHIAFSFIQSAGIRAHGISLVTDFIALSPDRAAHPL
ncbi:hypothetical protein NY2A_b299R [Paramecium bursaria Chlorella virus NY2A]|uniref:Uncharacterized protein b299R n=1 Tax=Paramecium bursaria Chlorella virus NY2A TaxID=46021 RepID=A7IWH4_PBCVN|nr:hypothetical protein NY2A_b299R [Paramecium bursaria Chlorella virus NY2A]ABT14698.1 hypothetical protein NY2A_b299R [Paramecium bursaria Chlorella virus NY2A]